MRIFNVALGTWNKDFLKRISKLLYQRPFNRVKGFLGPPTAPKSNQPSGGGPATVNAVKIHKQLNRSAQLPSPGLHCPDSV
ncbi:MAG: hypothetical protein K9K88_13000 [Desulfobacterales bacterium]|nr:hypothetical protein [Desulfobacterales bacterium]